MMIEPHSCCERGEPFAVKAMFQSPYGQQVDMLFAVLKVPVWMMNACRWEPWLDTETGLSPIATLATLSSSSSGASTDRLIQDNTGKEGPLGKRNR